MSICTSILQLFILIKVKFIITLLAILFKSGLNLEKLLSSKFTINHKYEWTILHYESKYFFHLTILSVFSDSSSSTFQGRPCLFSSSIKGSGSNSSILCTPVSYHFFSSISFAPIIAGTPVV